MTHNVLVGEGNHTDALDAAQNFGSFQQAGAFALCQVDLCQVPRNDRLGTIPDTGQEHFHLFRCGVLGFIQYDIGVIQCTSAHIRQRRHFNQPFFHIFCEIFYPHNFVQRIIEGAQVRVYLLLQIPRQKAQFFPCFNGRTGQNDAVDFIVFECGDGHCHCQISFPCTSRTNAKYHRIVLHQVDIFFLPHGLGF